MVCVALFTLPAVSYNDTQLPKGLTAELLEEIPP
jgi:hypothetical protein